MMFSSLNKIAVSLEDIEPRISTFADDNDHMHPRFPRGAAPKNIEELSPDFWIRKAQFTVNQHVNTRFNTNKAQNVILFVGDGMSIPTLAATRVYKAGGGEEAELSFEKFPHIGLSKVSQTSDIITSLQFYLTIFSFHQTYCLNQQVPDSACSATAYLSGVKGNYGTIGLNGRANRLDCTQGLNPAAKTSSIAKWAQDAGKVAGLVTTTRVTHASPASVYANVADRDWENNLNIRMDGCDDNLIDDIAEQLAHGDVGKNLKVVLGGGRREFLDRTMNDEEGRRGYRDDGKNLIEEWKLNPGRRTYVWNKPDLINVSPANTDYLLGMFENSHNLYHLEAVENNVLHNEPTLKEMVSKAIDILSTHPEGFFLFVEGGRIDSAHHDLQARRALEETVQFAEAVEYARARMSVDNTLIVVTADHSHTMSYAGYGVSILSAHNGVKGSKNNTYLSNSRSVVMTYWSSVVSAQSMQNPISH